MCNAKQCIDKNPKCYITLFTCIGLGFLMLNVIWYWFISDEHNASGIILSLYVIFFAVVIFLCKVMEKPKRLLETFQFMCTKSGPGVFIIFCGCISMDEEWIHVRNFWSIVVMVMGSFVWILDCKYTENTQSENIDKSEVDNGLALGGKPVALSDMGAGSFGGHGGKMQKNANQNVNVDFPSNSNSSQGNGGQQMFVSDQKYQLEFNSNNPHGDQGGNDGGNPGGLAAPIY
jgi:hypothetical protein